MERLIQTEHERSQIIKFVESHKLPMTVSVLAGKHRTLAQNKLQRMWMNEISEQLGDMTPEEVRGFCKLTLGVPILRAESERFREAYDRLIKPHTYEEKLQMMQGPLDFPTTRLMSTRQKTQYLDDVHRYWSEKGIVLTEPLR